MRLELFYDDLEYMDRLYYLMINNYDIIDHGIDDKNEVYWIRYYVREYILSGYRSAV